MILLRSLVAGFELVASTPLKWREQFGRHPQYLHVLECLDILGRNVDVHVPTTSGECQLLRGNGSARLTGTITGPKLNALGSSETWLCSTIHAGVPD